MSRVRVAVGVIKNNQGQVLISKRKKGVHKEGFWEFPGGKLENNESAGVALARELEEELNIKVTASIPLINVLFDYPELEVDLYVRVVEAFSGVAVGAEEQFIKWVDIEQLKDYQFPEANIAIIKAIALPREYAIINSSNINEVLLQLDSMASQGLKLVQIRAKDLLSEQATQFFKRLNEKCMYLGLKYLLNSAESIYKKSSGGVHLTSVQLMALTCKPESNGYIAASCHNLKELKQAEQLGLDFVVLSPVKETQSHPSAKLLGWSGVEQLLTQVNIPVYALGGMNKNDFNQAVNLGAQGISGIGLFK